MGCFFRLMQRPSVVGGRTSSAKHSGRCVEALEDVLVSRRGRQNGRLIQLGGIRLPNPRRAAKAAELNLVVDDFVRRRHY
jgi:hypothetical protein